MENPLVAGVLVALLVPFLGNTLGAALVLFARHGMSERFTKALLGFAAGVMIAASVWSLITPALEAAEGGPVPAWAPAAVGFLGGMLLLLVIDHFKMCIRDRCYASPMRWNTAPMCWRFTPTRSPPTTWCSSWTRCV